MKLLHTLALTTLVLSLMGVPAFAQFDDSLTFTVSPAITEFAGNPGDSIEGRIVFTNDGDFPAAGTFEVESLLPIDDIIDQGRRSEFDASSWIELDVNDIVFAPKQEQVLNFTIAIPEQANPGGHYALITLKPGVVQEPGAEPRTQVTPELSASVFITVAGDIDEQAEIVEEDLATSRITQGSSHTFEFRIRNTGNVHILPAPRLTISQGDQTIEIFSFQPQLILPNTEKTFSVDWTADVNPGSYGLRAETVYGSASIPLATPEQSFSVTPQFLHLFLLALLIPLIIYLFVKRRNIPRMYAALRGYAHYSGKRYTRSAGREDLPKASDTDSITAVARELQKQPEILGYPEPASLEPPPATSKPKRSKKVGKKAEVISKTKVTDAQSTTFITQTSASTIVREASPMYDPEKDEEVKPSKVIAVQHHDEIDSKTQKTKTKRIAKKKPATAKTTKSSTKKASSKKSQASKAKPKKAAASKKKASTTSKPTAKSKTKTKTKPKTKTRKATTKTKK